MSSNDEDWAAFGAAVDAVVGPALAPDRPVGLPRDRRPKGLKARARHAIDRIADVLECDEIDGSDRVALEDARAALSRHAGEEG